MTDAPSCPVSFSQIPSLRVTRNNPYTPISKIRDAVNKIPRAVDLPSAITAINIMNNIITMINRGEPQVNNVYETGLPSVILKGQDFDPHYEKGANWILEGRTYDDVAIYNPDDEELDWEKKQQVKIKILKAVYFHHVNEGASLTYYQDLA